MAINDGIIQGSITSVPLREELRAVNGSTATANSIKGSQNTLPAKAGLEALRAGTATRAGINALAIDPTAKAIMMKMAGFENEFILPLTGVRATPAIGSVTAA